ncbi:antitoxin AF2212-like protein [Baaleninema sp.]|uniref:antitoxin AF2212-like protein n=1 Tax=Baaleninema sp. TaxID=3101197 RepID=UPI0028F985A3|nr:DUF104 domain-containing protein [Geitlerinema sp. CS-897]
MSKIKAVFDGEVFRPSEPIELEPNTIVEIEIETVNMPESQEVSFFDVVESLNLEGPSDWAKNLDKYLYGLESDEEG